MSTDGSGTGEGAGAGAAEAKKLADLVKANPGLQDELNVMMAENRRNLTKQNGELVGQLEQLKQNTRLTQEERDELQSRITQLEEQYMTKEELSKRENAKKEKTFQKEIETATKEKESWRNLYASETIDRSLQDAAIEGKALRPSQIVDILRNRTQLVEVMTSDGQPTGRYAPVVKFNDVNDEGKPVILDLSPSETIKRMRELTENYGNLFEGTATSGLGETGGASGSKTQPLLKEILADPAKYAEWRKKNPDLDISKLRR